MLCLTSLLVVTLTNDDFVYDAYRTVALVMIEEGGGLEYIEIRMVMTMITADFHGTKIIFIVTWRSSKKLRSVILVGISQQKKSTFVEVRYRRTDEQMS